MYMHYYMQDDEDSFHVVDLSRVIHLYDAWKDKLPQVQAFYAVKCNEDPALVKTLAALGTGFDRASIARHTGTTVIHAWNL